MNVDRGDNPVRQVRRDGDTVIVEIAGEVNMHRSSAFQRALMALLDDWPWRIVLDLAGVTHMDSAGLAGLIKLLSEARRLRIDLWLCAPTPAVRSLLEVTRLITVFNVADSISEVPTG